jgi:hypothetical protein
MHYCAEPHDVKKTLGTASPGSLEEIADFLVNRIENQTLNTKQ